MKVYFGTTALAPGVTYDGESGAQEFAGKLRQRVQVAEPVRASFAVPIPRKNWQGSVSFRADVACATSAAAEAYVRTHLTALLAAGVATQTLKVVGEGATETEVWYRDAALEGLDYGTIGLRAVFRYEFSHGEVTNSGTPR